MAAGPTKKMGFFRAVTHACGIVIAAAVGTMASSGRTALGYDSVDDPANRRKQGPAVILNEDEYLMGGKRTTLQFNAADIHRNYSIVRWAVGRHLDYVSTFSFQATTGNDALDEQLERLMEEWSKAENCDVSGRLSLFRMIRMMEAQRVLKGDVVIVKMRDGRIQLIESDRVRNPNDLASLGIARDQIIEGVLVTKSGKALSFAVHKRLSGGRYEFERMVPSKYAIQFGYFDTVDQVRGISPLASALNSFRDTYENFDYALAKAKVAQMFGLILTRKALDAAGNIEEVASVDGEEPTESGEECDEQKPRYEIDFGKGPILLDMEPGEDAKFLENKTPAIEFQQFMQACISAAIKALDLPFSFYDESFSTYSGSRQALLQYHESAKIKRRELRELLDALTRWRVALWVMNGELVLPAGMALDQVRWEWIANGLPWIDPVKEKTADIMGINAGLDNPEDVCRSHGGDVYRNIDKTARVLRYAEKVGVKLSFSTTLSSGDVGNSLDPTTNNQAA